MADTSILAYVASVPIKFKKQYLKALEGKASPRTAIKMHCHECVGWSNIKEAIGGCQSKRCPLWQYRPYR